MRVEAGHVKLDHPGGAAAAQQVNEEEARPKRRAKFADTDTVSVSTATATVGAGGRFQDTAVVTPQTLTSTTE